MSISNKNTRTTITIPKDLKKELEIIAKEQNRSFNNLVITILKNSFDSTHKQSAFYMLITSYKFYAYSYKFVTLIQFSKSCKTYELLYVSIQRRLYHYLFIGIHHFHPLECTSITEQSLKFLLFGAYLLIVDYINTQGLTLCHTHYSFYFRNLHAQFYFILTLWLMCLYEFPAIQWILDSLLLSLHTLYEYGRLSTIF